MAGDSGALVVLRDLAGPNPTAWCPTPPGTLIRSGLYMSQTLTPWSPLGVGGHEDGGMAQAAKGLVEIDLQDDNLLTPLVY